MNIFNRRKGPDVRNRRREQGAGIAGRFAVETRKTDDSIVLGAGEPAPFVFKHGYQEDLMRTWDQRILDAMDSDEGIDEEEAVRSVIATWAVVASDRILTKAERDRDPDGRKHAAAVTITDTVGRLGGTVYGANDAAGAAEEIARARASLAEEFRGSGETERLMQGEADRELECMQHYILNKQQSRDEYAQISAAEEGDRRLQLR